MCYVLYFNVFLLIFLLSSTEINGNIMIEKDESTFKKQTG